ncbi:ATP cone domain-containing protein [Flavobacterium sp. SM15]|uniref:ATP cone domain-containing protein n=1 Tax=Flavobacterium sp. SM15 TaxID=2908005 RepID=UPI001EDAD2A6|nr:ATP cone domain-containing protein [Flavobacterium sp. SM15]MCG2610683.1 ATP cone domain-containing protein [Flavobacterium sp. SM15]
MKVIKQSGDIVHFDREKLRNSLQLSGAKSEKIDDILNIIEREIYDGMPTRKIYKMAFQLLKKTSKVHAARYNLKAAVQALGPAGFFFEKYIALLFRTEDFATKTNVILNGKCVSHEIDVMVKKAGAIAMVECKFHSTNDIKSDVKIPMYILSRYNDLRGKTHSVFSQDDTISKCWVITNNRFTSEAIQFGTCSNLKMVSWDFPAKECLKYKIEENGLYPVTCLTTLTQYEKEKLLIREVLLASDLVDNSELLSDIGINHNRIKNIIREASDLCDYVGNNCSIFKD